MKIGKVVYLNLVRRPDRRAHILGEFARNKFPSDQIEWFHARDGFDFRTNDEICAAMHADGFGETVSRRIQNTITWQHPGDFACLWSRLCIYRDFVKSGVDTVLMFIEDDCIIQKDWSYIQDVVGSLPADFKILHLDYLHPEDGDPHLEKSPTYTDALEYNSEVCHGLGGLGDHAIIMTQAGARQLLSWSDTYVPNRFGGGGFHGDSILWERSFDFPEGCFYMKPGYITRPVGKANDSDRDKWRETFM